MAELQRQQQGEVKGQQRGMSRWRVDEPERPYLWFRSRVRSTFPVSTFQMYRAPSADPPAT